MFGQIGAPSSSVGTRRAGSGSRARSRACTGWSGRARPRAGGQAGRSPGRPDRPASAAAPGSRARKTMAATSVGSKKGRPLPPSPLARRGEGDRLRLTSPPPRAGEGVTGERLPSPRMGEGWGGGLHRHQAAGNSGMICWLVTWTRPRSLILTSGMTTSAMPASERIGERVPGRMPSPAGSLYARRAARPPRPARRHQAGQRQRHRRQDLPSFASAKPPPCSASVGPPAACRRLMPAMTMLWLSWATVVPWAPGGCRAP